MEDAMATTVKRQTVVDLQQKLVVLDYALEGLRASKGEIGPQEVEAVHAQVLELRSLARAIAAPRGLRG
jgi:hypothetical protein